MTPRQRRMLWVTVIVLGVSIATFLALAAFQKNLLYFYTPSQIAAGEAPTNYAFRVGGLVKEGSVHRDPDSLAVRFTLTDGAAEVTVFYEGILPDLFREGQGIIAIGQLQQDGLFKATQVLAKHDENYMPPEVADALKKSGKLPPVDDFEGTSR
ncbi:cytochrome c-type biogenesis protein CcmE [Methylomarinovum tepidoasis]|uniref:Cytochrome c-type biogenesis protein CcmE n=1 Tax=Methylomarinovum tepidoasis TaxID=2840183 RepID=A0AAU9BYP6_9GAMM|nr:cytochrome c maturation protein CcmE [Methylomarinovum sp. IN45]BCX88880.1 cytochrome c-type biogenesis protein CcmE [Methylomarinovum sp. IN45]